MMQQNIKQNIDIVSEDNIVPDDLNDSLMPQRLAKQVLIKGENKRDFFDLVHHIRVEMRAQTRIEEEFIKKYIFSAWKLRRLREVEKNILEKQNIITEEERYESDGNRPRQRIRNIKKIRIDTEVELLNDQQERLEKQMVKALRQLREEQSRRVDSQNKNV
ncbi:MAG: hypothetical protein WCV79_02290 [Candidatus Paceibacterota bacterium]|jgi:hypothetical protein